MPSDTSHEPLTLNGHTVGGSPLGKHHSSTNDDVRQPNRSISENGKSEARSSLPNGGEGSHKRTQVKKSPVIDITKDLSALISKQMLATPNAVALEDETTTLTYSELDQKVTILANRLRNHKVGRDKLVGVLLGRSANYVIACLAALRAGGAFLVLELAYPPNLLADVIEDAKPRVVITNEAQAAQIEADIPLILLDKLDLSSEIPLDASKKVPPLPADDDLERLAFVSYSS